mgnify:CR=1 FL=1
MQVPTSTIFIVYVCPPIKVIWTKYYKLYGMEYRKFTLIRGRPLVLAGLLGHVHYMDVFQYICISYARTSAYCSQYFVPNMEFIMELLLLHIGFQFRILTFHIFKSIISIITLLIRAKQAVLTEMIKHFFI